MEEEKELTTDREMKKSAGKKNNVMRFGRRKLAPAQIA